MPQSSFDSTELPALQPRTHCVLIPRDPNFIYAYWDYTQADLKCALNELRVNNEDARLILRIHDITLIDFNGANANHTWDLDVGLSNKNCYVHVWQDNANYCAQLGVSCGEDRFFPLIQSNIVCTPPKSTSKRNDLIWQDIKAHKESQPYIEENIEGRRKRKENLMQQLSKKKISKTKESRKPRVYYLTAKDIRDYYMDLFARVSRKRRRKGQVFSIEDFLKGKLRGLSWQKVRPILAFPDIIRRTHPGASMQAASMRLLDKKGASEKLSGVQSGASEGRLLKRKFFFEIWSEVIVYGRTEPDAALFLNQKGIKLNPDGTFSLRYALPDGEIPFKFIAQSSDGIEQRHIYTRVQREKTIGFPKMLR